MKYPPVEIRIILSSSSTRQTDHVVSVKVMPNGYVWGYNDPTVSAYHLLELESVDDVLRQFDIMVSGLTFDIDPYRSLQFNVPALPPVMVYVRDLQMHLTSIKKMLQNALVRVPQAMTQKEADEYMEQDDDEEDEEAEEADDEAEDDEAEYADMPPLVALNEPPRHGYFTRLQERLQATNNVGTHTYFS